MKTNTGNGIRHVVIICPYLFALQRGIERYCLGLADALIDLGIDVTMYVWDAKDAKSCGEINKRIKIRRVPSQRYFQDRIASWFYRRWLKIDDPDITILNFMYHGEEFLPDNRPYLYILHSPASQIPGRYEYAQKQIGRFNKIGIVAISKMVYDEAYPYLGKKPMHLIYNGTDTDRFRPAEAERKSGKLQIITAAAFEKRKGMHYVIEALRDFDLKDRIEYHIYGGGDETYGEYLRKMIADYHLESCVKMMGSVSNIPELLPEYDLFALPSKGEAFALSPIEAMCCGVPILVSDCPPYPEFVTDDFGFMVRRDDPGQIREALSKLIGHPETLHQMKRNARIKGLEYSWKRVVEKYIQAIKDTIK